MAETQEMLDFCARHEIVSDVEMVPIQAVNTAFERLEKNDVRYRFVIEWHRSGKIPGLLRPGSRRMAARAFARIGYLFGGRCPRRAMAAV